MLNLKWLISFSWLFFKSNSFKQFSKNKQTIICHAFSCCLSSKEKDMESSSLPSVTNSVCWKIKLVDLRNRCPIWENKPICHGGARDS